MSDSEPILGNTTKFSSRADFEGRYGNVALRFYLLEIARNILKDERIQVCWRYPLPERRTIEIIYSDERKCARAKGTMKCGSGWVCPVCMRYIAERRREELETAMKRTNDQYFSVMATFTVRHNAGNRLRELLTSMVAAYGNTFAGRWMVDLRQEYMLAGAIRATEVTFGKNGWHPHFHVIYFVDKQMLDDKYAGSPEEYAQSLQTQIGARWIGMLDKAGLSASNQNALDVRSSNAGVAEYISKYGKMPTQWTSDASAYEVTHSVTKTPAKGNFGVLDILYAAAEDTRYKNLFKEYHMATKGRSMLHWSKGLKKMLDIEIIRDEIAAKGIETETDRLLALIETEFWKFLSERGHIGQLMSIANNGDAKTLGDFLMGRRDVWQNLIEYLPQFDKGH